MISIAIAFCVLCLILMVVFTAKILLLVLLTTGTCACLAAWLWKTPDPQKAQTKKAWLIGFVITAQIVAVPFALQQAKLTLFPDHTNVDNKRVEIDELFKRSDIEDKFARGYAIAASAEEPWEQRNLQSYVGEAFERSNPQVQFSTMDLAEAQKEYEARLILTNTQEQDICVRWPTAMPAKIIVNREGPASVVNFLREHHDAQEGCDILGSILYEVEKKCESIWVGRCATEIDQQELEAFLEQPIHPASAQDIKFFIASIFKAK